MSLVCALAVLLAAPTAEAAAHAGDGAAAPEPAVDRRAARERHAARQHAARRYAEAAREYEALYDQLRDTSLLLAAARSRQAARHHAHVVAYLSQLVASGQLTAADTQVAYGELQAAQREVTPVTVRVQLPVELAAESPRLTAQYVPQRAADSRPALEFPLPPGAGPVRVVMLQLDPGRWRLQVDSPRFAAVDVLVDVLVQPGAAVQLDLRGPAEPPGLPLAQRRRLAGVIGGLGGALVGVGVGLTVRGQLGQVAPTLERPASACPELLACREALAAAVTGRDLGVGLLAAGAGSLVSGLTALVSDPRQRRTMWIFELALGGAGVVGSGLAAALAARGFDRENVTGTRLWGDRDYVDEISRKADQHAVAAAGLGLGSGLVLGAATGLIHTRVHRRMHRTYARRVRPGLGMGAGRVGVTLSGRF